MSTEAIGTITPDFQKLLDLARATAEPQIAHCGSGQQIPYVVIPQDHQVVGLERLLGTPTRKRARVTLTDAQSFIDYVNLHGQHGTCLYANPDDGLFIVVIDDHQGHNDGAAWREHAARYTCAASTEWKTWDMANKIKMTQADFAQFIEDNLPDILAPAAADILEIARGLQAKKNVNFASALRLDNGDVQFTYEDKTEATAGKGQLKVPEKFVIAIPVFQGGPAYSIEARLRYRIADGQLAMWYDLLRPHKSREHALDEIREFISNETQLPILTGNPNL